MAGRSIETGDNDVVGDDSFAAVSERATIDAMSRVIQTQVSCADRQIFIKFHLWYSRV
jgi:hypothetical protein